MPDYSREISQTRKEIREMRNKLKGMKKRGVSPYDGLSNDEIGSLLSQIMEKKELIRRIKQMRREMVDEVMLDLDNMRTEASRYMRHR